MTGTPGGYYMRQGAATDSWLIHLEGGGWCVSHADCVCRAQTEIGSSKDWPQVLPSSFSLLPCNLLLVPTSCQSFAVFMVARGQYAWLDET